MINRGKIFVAGGTGFLGQRVVKQLKDDGLNYCQTSLDQGVDFRDFNQTKGYFAQEKPVIVINCAAFVGGIKFGLEHAGEMFYNNNLISTYLIEASRLFEVERYINIISNCTYPDVSKKFKEEEWWDGPLHESVLSYGIVRKSSWVNTFAYRKQYGMNFINLILASMYGPEDHFDEVKSHALGALVMKFIEAKRKSLPKVVIWGTGKPIREWLYIDDGAEAIIRALGIKPVIEPINIGRGEGVSILELAKLIKKLSGYKGEIILDKSKPDGAPYKVFDVSKMEEIFKWFPPTTLEEGIKKTINWYENNLN